jgi:hypothetical protein
MQVSRTVLNVVGLELMPAVGCLEHILFHGLPETQFVLLRAGDCGLVPTASRKSSVFDPTLEFLIPSVRANTI